MPTGRRRQQPMADFDLVDFSRHEVERNDVEDDTSFIDDPAAPLGGTDFEQTSTLQQGLAQELLQDAVDGYYNALKKQGLTPATGRDYSKFILDKKGRLTLKAHPGFEIINRMNGKPLALATIYGRGGGDIIKSELGFADWTRHKTLNSKALGALQSANEELGEAAAAVGSVDLQDVPEHAKKASDAVETALTDADVNKILGTFDDAPLNLRELQGLDKALQRIRGELVNNLAKLTELDDHIALEKRKLDEAPDEFSRRRIAERLRSLQDERVARVEAPSAGKEALRSQIN